jgi:hypothetical protein
LEPLLVEMVEAVQALSEEPLAVALVLDSRLERYL